MKKKLLVLSLTLMIAVLFTHGAVAAGAGNTGCSHESSGLNVNNRPLAQKLDLTDRQVEQFKEINLNTYQAARPLKIKLFDARFQLRQLKIDGKDQAGIEVKTREINDLKDQLHKLHQQKRQKIQSILTLEQQAKLKAIKDPGQHGAWNKQDCH
ncbi:MAG: Spy/CpxP family protein refolding chaperone [Deltaproteobacteria bacterium]